MFTAGIAGLTDFAAAAVPAIALPVAGVVFGTGRLALGDRRWQTWLGLVLASAPALFWVAFAIGELVGPKH
jgi:4-amino-4-deoxy-L-arabinose transferase-like glycosyltransferase